MEITDGENFRRENIETNKNVNPSLEVQVTKYNME